MKIKDLDEEMLDYYCSQHVCDECSLNKISDERCTSCFDLLDLIKNQSDGETEISILTKEEWLYLKAIIEPFGNLAETITITKNEIQIKIRYKGICRILKSFEFKGLIKDKDYTLQELDL